MDKICLELQLCKGCRFNDYEVNKYDESKGHGKLGCHAYSKEAKIMIIGQNPSHARYPGNHSLSGKQGDHFRKVFGEKNLIMTNLVPYSTPDNKIFVEDAIHGLTHLIKQIEHYKPNLIIGLGSWNRNTLSQYIMVKGLRELEYKTTFLKHPDYFYKYNPGGLEKYNRQIEDVHKSYLQAFANDLESKL